MQEDEMIRIDKMPYFSAQIGFDPTMVGVPAGFMVTAGSFGFRAYWYIRSKVPWTPGLARKAGYKFFRVWPKGSFGKWDRHNTPVGHAD